MALNNVGKDPGLQCERWHGKAGQRLFDPSRNACARDLVFATLRVSVNDDDGSVASVDFWL